MNSMLSDVRDSLRACRRQPWFTAVVVLTLALGIGANTAIFSLIYGILLRPFPYREPDRLVRIQSVFTKTTGAVRFCSLLEFHDCMMDRLRELPGVTAIGGSNSLPYTSGQVERSKGDLSLKGRNDEEVKQSAPLVGADVTPGYLETMGIPLHRGRYFDRRDTNSSRMVVIVNERAAKTLWPGHDPIGQQIRWGTASNENPYCTVIGVVGNIRNQAGERDGGVDLYYPHTQYPVSNIYYVLRTSMEPERLAASVRTAIREVDRDAAIVWMKSMATIMEESLWQRRLWGVLFGVFAGLALTLAAIGIYGVVGYMVSQRTREIGIRPALGARRTSVLALVIGRGFGLVLAGLAAGLGSSLALSRVIRSLLFGVTATDAVTFASVPVFLMLVALAACYLPARRAAGVDPVVALRQEG